MTSIQFQNKKISFYQEGEGIPIVFLHGFCEDSRMWEDFIPQFSKNQIIRIDLPGFGFSEVDENISIQKMAEAVNGVLNHLKIEKCFLIGHSMGGYVTLEFAKHFGKKLLGFCLFHSHPFKDSPEKSAGRDKGINFIKRNGHIYYVKQVIPSLFAYDFSKGYQFEVNKLIYNASQYSPKGIIAALEAMKNRMDNSEVLEKVNCPVLFIIGKEDAAVATETSLKMTHLPKMADIQIFPKIGHMGMFEAKRKTAKVINGFVRRLTVDDRFA